ncbi:MAG TPA: protein kinase [Candidatus Dormibacteraeota bacterium]|jgi:hypothetical protein|nr:protein kinase [Candidatus Dormibacteraeota bacterium]
MTEGSSADLEGYVSVSVLGSGATGVVRVMRQEAGGGLEAVKFLADPLVGDRVFRARFRHEAAILERLRHPHIASLLWYVEDERVVAIGMELVDGVQLRRVIASGVASPEAALVVLRGSLSALQHAHAAGVVHRDYKPANVLVDGQGISRLVDFGIAAGVGEAGVVEGTPAYTAPEQWRGEAATPATDVYACAAVLHECLTGHPPFESPDIAELRRLHESAEVPLEGVPVALHPLLLRGLAKRADQRYAGAGEFLDDLEQIASTSYGGAWVHHGTRALAGLALGFAAFFPVHALSAAAATSAPAAGAQGAAQAGAPAATAPPATPPASPPGQTLLARATHALAGSPVAAAVIAVSLAVIIAVGGLAVARAGPFATTSTGTPVAAALAGDFGSSAGGAAEGGLPGSASLATATTVSAPDGRLIETVVLRGPSAIGLSFAFCDSLVCGTSENLDCVGNLYIPRFGGAYLLDATVAPPPGSHAQKVLVLAGNDAGALAPVALAGGGASAVEASVLSAAPRIDGSGVTLSFVSPIGAEIRKHIRGGVLCGFNQAEVAALHAAYGDQVRNDTTSEVRVVIDWSPPSGSLSSAVQTVSVNGTASKVPLQPAQSQKSTAPAFTTVLQGDSRWASTAAGKSSTYGASGTVPTTLSTLLSGFGVHRDPPAIGKQLVDAGIWKPGTGTDWKGLQGYIASAAPLSVSEVDVFQALGALHSGAAVMVAYTDHRPTPAQDLTAVITDYDPGTDTFGVIDPVSGAVRISWDDLCGGAPWFLAVSRPAAGS